MDVKFLHNVPKSIAIIMDGNRRWARLKGYSDIEGYRKGVESLRCVLAKSLDVGVSSVVVYAFSAENFARPQEEVCSLLELMVSQLNYETEAFFIKNNIRVSFIGDITVFSSELISLTRNLEQKTLLCNGMHFGIALNYGSRQELFRAALSFVGKDAVKLTEKDFVTSFYTRDFLDIDLLIRSGGEKRLSNFLLWNLAYSELYFSDVLWPDFGENEFLLALRDYSKRSRRYGK